MQSNKMIFVSLFVRH